MPVPEGKKFSVPGKICRLEAGNSPMTFLGSGMKFA